MIECPECEANAEACRQVDQCDTCIERAKNHCVMTHYDGCVCFVAVGSNGRFTGSEPVDQAVFFSRRDAVQRIKDLCAKHNIGTFEHLNHMEYE